VLAHIAGVPVEETVLGLAPLGLAGVGLLSAYASQRARAWRRPRRRDASVAGDALSGSPPRPAGRPPG
jgi:hypothetical protein